jgi:DNA repair exonuclease SbcCD ATPase subunit
MTLNTNTLPSWRTNLNKAQGRKELLESQLIRIEKDNEEKTIYLENLQVSRSLIQKAAQLTQEKLSVHIGDLVSLALRSVFEDPYEFQAVFENRRNSMECDLNFVKNGNEYKPLDSCGYGAADVASFALRIAYWSLGATRPVLIWDEPFRQLDKKKQGMAAEMVARLSKELGLQIIIITHSDELAESADKVFRVSIENGISKVV